MMLFFPWMNVEDNISYSPRVTNNYNDEEKSLVDKYIDLVGLQDFRKGLAKTTIRWNEKKS